MRWLSAVMSCCALMIPHSPGIALAEQANRLLSHNPFDKPSILAVPGKLADDEHYENEENTIEITATLVSDTMPLVIAAGEMLSIGESVNGYRLVSVDESNATFIKNGATFTFSLTGSGTEMEK